jgi:hypothetical protein
MGRLRLWKFCRTYFRARSFHAGAWGKTTQSATLFALDSPVFSPVGIAKRARMHETN